ncbi:hypothetical protein PINS_up009624 [Pythium insidiosum]|nr:hypothetical protein PINS_up009624 [Pythium insidiosum]
MSGYVGVTDPPVASPVKAVDVEAQKQQYPSNAIRVGAWDANFCGCFDHMVPNCCMATFLPCVSMAQIAHRLEVYSYLSVHLVYLALQVAAIVLSALSMSSDDNEKYYHRSESESYVTTHLAITGVLCILASLLVWQFRATTRSRYQIPGNCCLDCFVSCCCSCCTIAQMATHVKSYKPGSCDFGPPDTLPAYDQ